jgi:predicted dithiol-disulfide oxidoreductase (DUF899 family)
MLAHQVAHLAHLNARDTTLVFVSRTPRDAIARLKKRMGWDVPRPPGPPGDRRARAN